MKPISNEKRELLIGAKQRCEKEADIAFPLDFIVFDSILVSKKERSYFEGDFYRKKRIDYTGKTSR